MDHIGPKKHQSVNIKITSGGATSGSTTSAPATTAPATTVPTTAAPVTAAPATTAAPTSECGKYRFINKFLKNYLFLNYKFSFAMGVRTIEAQNCNHYTMKGLKFEVIKVIIIRN